MGKKNNSKRWNFGISRGPIPFRYWLRASLPQFKQLSILKDLNPSSLSKVMIV